MFESLKAEQLFLSTNLGLNRVFKMMNTDGTQGLTYSELSKTNVAYYNKPFAQLLKSNFSDIDTDSNGIISSTELKKAITSISTKGLSFNDIATISYNSASNSTDKTLLQTVMSNFAQVDKNGDGRVTTSEINSYLVNSEISKKTDETSKISKSNEYDSLFYSSDSDDDITDDDTTI